MLLFQVISVKPRTIILIPELMLKAQNSLCCHMKVEVEDMVAKERGSDIDQVYFLRDLHLSQLMRREFIEHTEEIIVSLC